MEEIGRQLRAAREARAITLEVAEEDTKIRRKYLEALEAGRIADLPGEAYLKGFLRTYGNYLGLEGSALVEEYKQAQQMEMQRLAGPTAESPTRRQTAAASEPEESPRVAAVSRLRRAAAEEAPGRPQERPAKRPGRERQPKAVTARGLGITLGILALVGGISFLGYLLAGQIGDWAANGNGEPTQQQTGQPNTGAVDPGPTNPAPTNPAPSNPAPAQPEPKVTMVRGAGQDVSFTVKATQVEVTLEPGGQRIWMSITVDGKVVNGNLYPTGPVTYTGKEIIFRVGHMNGVNLVVNGERLTRPLENGPYTLTFKAQ